MNCYVAHAKFLSFSFVYHVGRTTTQQFQFQTEKKNPHSPTRRSAGEEEEWEGYRFGPYRVNRVGWNQRRLWLSWTAEARQCYYTGSCSVSSNANANSSKNETRLANTVSNRWSNRILLLPIGPVIVGRVHLFWISGPITCDGVGGHHRRREEPGSPLYQRPK